MLTLKAIQTVRVCWEVIEGGTINFAVWPADVGPDLVQVKINTTDFGDYLKNKKALFNSDKTPTTLEDHRDLIQDLARSKNIPTVPKGVIPFIILDKTDFGALPVTRAGQE